MKVSAETKRERLLREMRLIFKIRYRYYSYFFFFFSKIKARKIPVIPDYILYFNHEKISELKFDFSIFVYQLLRFTRLA